MLSFKFNRDPIIYWSGSDGTKTPYIETAAYGLYAVHADRVTRIRSVKYAVIYA